MVERFPIAGSFTIARGSKTEAVVVMVEITEGESRGRGEAVPYARYGETPDSVLSQIQSISAQVTAGLTREGLQRAMSAGAARNAVDCALWDLECRLTGRDAADLAGLQRLQPRTTAFTISLGSIPSMQAQARENAWRPVLKIKLGADEDGRRIQTIREAAPNAQLIVDANEGWRPDNLEENLSACRQCEVALIEQPLPEGHDDALVTCSHAVPICADESIHTRADLPRLRSRYDAVNIKLDKTGGLTEALELVRAARDQGFKIMAGCMVGTSLAMAPAVLVAQAADYVDLDGPLLLARDRDTPIRYIDGKIQPADGALWGASPTSLRESAP